MYPEQEIFVVRKLEQTPPITEEIKQNIELIDADFTKNVRNKKKLEIEKVDPNIIKMNRLIQRRYIKERLEKKNEERKDGELVDYKVEISDSLPNLIQNAEVKTEGSNENKNVEFKNPENAKANRYLNM